MRCKLSKKAREKLKNAVVPIERKIIECQVAVSFNTIKRLIEGKKNSNSSTVYQVFQKLGLKVEEEDIIFFDAHQNPETIFLKKGSKIMKLLQTNSIHLNKILSITEKETQKGNTVCLTAVNQSNPYKNRKCIYTSKNFPPERILIENTFEIDFTEWWKDSMFLLEELVDKLKLLNSHGYGLTTNFKEILTRPDGSKTWYIKDYLWFPGEPGICLSIGEPNNWGLIK